MIFYFIFILFSVLLAYINNTFSKKLFYPPAYLCFIWILFIIIHLLYFSFSNYKPNILTFRSLFYFFLMLLFFSLGGVFSKGLLKNKKPDLKISFPNIFLNTILLLNIVCLIFYFLKIKELTGSYFDLLMYRYYTSVKGVDIGIIKYSLTFTIFSSLIVLIDFYNRRGKRIVAKIRLILIFFLSFSLAFLSASRGTFMFLLIGCLGIYSVYNKINLKLVFKTVGITLTVFIVMATLMKKSMPNEHTSKIKYSAIDKVEYLLYSYSSLPLSAFDKFINEPYKITYGEIALRFPKAVLYKMGIIKSTPKELVEEYVKVPDSVNVYTSYYKLIKDFGVIYSFIAMFFFGYLHTYFYSNSRKSFGSLIGFATLLFPLTMTFFEDNYLSILSTWVQIMLLVYLTNFFVKKEYV